VPWAYTRAVLAEHWHCLPLTVDWIAAHDPGEINEALELLALRSPAAPRSPRRGPR
jgi:hypothetical protein